eukprot:1917724-Rhodomonas_salina.1
MFANRGWLAGNYQIGGALDTTKRKKDAKKAVQRPPKTPRNDEGQLVPYQYQKTKEQQDAENAAKKEAKKKKRKEKREKRKRAEKQENAARMQRGEKPLTKYGFR